MVAAYARLSNATVNLLSFSPSCPSSDIAMSLLLAARIAPVSKSML